MRVYVDRDLCETHGQCVIAAPDVFAIDEHDTLVYLAAPPDELRSVIEDAVDGCPTQAISLEA